MKCKEGPPAWALENWLEARGCVKIGRSLSMKCKKKAELQGLCTTCKESPDTGKIWISVRVLIQFCRACVPISTLDATIFQCLCPEVNKRTTAHATHSLLTGSIPGGAHGPHLYGQQVGFRWQRGRTAGQHCGAEANQVNSGAAERETRAWQATIRLTATPICECMHANAGKFKSPRSWAATMQELQSSQTTHPASAQV